ncbi:hypothetical protein [Phascolarctobacterium succinatutens]|uniref:hypothetical protein n=1 Tax=Phascolarctobacterium succinatutens TaxID=626940 RepID=UPI003AEFB3D8
MTKNLIPGITKMLGVELNEEFKVDKYDEMTFKFAENMLVARADFKGAKWGITYVVLSELLGGDAEIVKMSWKPKLNERYWTFMSSLEGGKLYVLNYMWDNSVIDVALHKVGWVFRTCEEAEAALPKVAAEMGVEYEI